MNDLFSCGGSCPDESDSPNRGSERRAFLRQALGCVAGTLAFVGVSGIDAPAFAIEMVTAVAQGNERRYPLPAADGVSVDRGSQVILARVQGKVYAMALACPHQNAVVKWLPSEQRFQCTKHDSKYQPSGIYTSGRATRNLDRFPVRRDGESIVVDASRVFRSDQDAGGWAAAFVAV